MIDLNQVMTFTEAADKWGFANGNTIRKAVERNKFLPAEIRKSGDVWLTTYAAGFRSTKKIGRSDYLPRDC